MRGVSLDRAGRLRWRIGVGVGGGGLRFGGVGGQGAAEVDLAVGGAGEDVGAAESGEGEGVDGAAVGADCVF